MFKLGEYCEEYARPIADHLKKAGFKVELKPSINSYEETDSFLQGRFSELKVDIKDKDTFERYERYLNVLKKVLEEKPSHEDFTRKYIFELFPTLEEKKAKVIEVLDSLEHEKDAKAGEETAGDANDQPDENRINEMKDLAYDLSEIFTEGEEVREFLDSVLRLNEIEPGEDIGDLLDDPVVAIPVDLDDYGEDHPRMKKVLSVYLDKCYDLYIDELSAIYSDRLDDEFIEQYTDEHLKIVSLDFLLSNLIKNHSSEKMDIPDFKDECALVIELKGRTMKVIGYDVAEEIARALEKNGMIKIKGNTIRWKK
jgi:hypothetical protein